MQVRKNKISAFWRQERFFRGISQNATRRIGAYVQYHTISWLIELKIYVTIPYGVAEEVPICLDYLSSILCIIYPLFCLAAIRISKHR